MDSSMSVSPASRKGRKRRQLTVADIPLEGVPQLDATLIDIPRLSQPRSYVLNSAAENFSMARADLRSVLKPPNNRKIVLQTESPVELCCTIMAYYKHVHSNGLRIYEELAYNLGLNVGDFVYLENELATRFKQKASLPNDNTCDTVDAATQLPPVALLVATLFCLDEPSLLALTNNMENSQVQPQDSSERPSKAELKSLILQRIVRRLDGDAAAHVDDSPSKGLYSDVIAALHSFEKKNLSRWVGTLSLLLASLHTLAATRSQEQVHVEFSVLYPTGQEAMQCVENAGAATPNYFLPPILPLQYSSSAKSPTVVLNRAVKLDEEGNPIPEETEEENPEEPRSAEEQARMRCSGWELPPGPTHVVYQCSAPRSYFADLSSSFLHGPSTLLVTRAMCQLAVTGYTPNELSIQLSPPQKASTTQSSSALEFDAFLKHVMEDAGKASLVASSIRTRLLSLFVQPHHCRTHPPQKYSHFCRVCQEFVCLACTRQHHMGHDVEPIAAFCVDEAVRLQSKRQQVLRRKERLEELLSGLEAERKRMSDAVNSGIDDVLGRLNGRKAYLHQDVSARAVHQKEELQRELERAIADRSKIDGAAHVASRMQLGYISEIPKIKMNKSWPVLDNLSLRLPTEELKKLVRLLSWSNPSKYLTNVVYPPPEPQDGHSSGTNAA